MLRLVDLDDVWVRQLLSQELVLVFEGCRRGRRLFGFVLGHLEGEVAACLAARGVADDSETPRTQYLLEAVQVAELDDAGSFGDGGLVLLLRRQSVITVVEGEVVEAVNAQK